MTNDQRRRVIESIDECTRLIDREEKMDAALRPADVAELLKFWKQHRTKLQNMLGA